MVSISHARCSNVGGRGRESGGSECTVRSVLHIKRDTGSGKRGEMNYTYGAHVQGAQEWIFI